MKAIILAAGEGKRMKSELPKVLHTLGGKPMLHYIIDTCLAAGIDDITVVVGKGADEVQKATPQAVHFVKQEEQLGTGHAVMCAKKLIAPDEQTVILCGDTPLITPGFIKNLMAFHKEKGAHGVVTSTSVPNPEGYGRIISTPGGDFEAIVEQRDLSPSQTDIKNINPGVYVFTGRELLYGLEHTDTDNSQQEYYLTDVPNILKEDGFKIAVYHASDHLQFLGINSQKQLAEAASVLRGRILDTHFDNGVTIIDPATTYIDADVEIEAGVTIGPGVMLHNGCRVGKGTVIRAYTIAEGAAIGENCQIGPFAYLRPGTVVGNNCRIGDFVELKNAKLGSNTTAAHLAYIGDAQIGDRVNFGCGAITVNYDGNLKHKTVVNDNVFVGSNVNLIAPVTVEGGAFVAAGSTITDDVPADAFAIARERQVTKEGGAIKYKTGRSGAAGRSDAAGGSD